MATIVIAADLCPIGNNRPFFEKGDARNLFNDLLPELESADLSVANLECPLIEKESPIAKTGPTFGAPPSCINAIKNGGFDALCLANNHILDHGADGLLTTLNACKRADVSVIGAGRNLTEAEQLFIRNIDGIRVAIIAMAEHEFSIADSNSPGANPLDLITFVRTVEARRNDFDFLIVLVHGGDEFHVPSPGLRRTCHFLVEMGADAVIVQHPHCLGGIEEYQGAHIVYGQGALVMDEELYRSRASFHEGFLVKLQLARSRNDSNQISHTLEIIPFHQSDPDIGAHRLTAERERVLRQSLEQKSKLVCDDAAVEGQWRRFCESRRHSYMSTLLGHGRILRRLNFAGWLTKLYGRKLLGARNVALCETHREVLETILKRR
jgi:poly-gamma-glutamate capsule biosynthesis protein CapA/YwtB (metallophosphatase superfamily)